MRHSQVAGGGPGWQVAAFAPPSTQSSILLSLSRMKIAFVGTGVMGKSMAANLLKAGHEVTAYTRTKSKAEDLFALGAKWAA